MLSAPRFYIGSVLLLAALIIQPAPAPEPARKNNQLQLQGRTQLLHAPMLGPRLWQETTMPSAKVCPKETAIGID
jgi:hypothetical protein